jgi:hypothetical protein
VVPAFLLALTVRQPLVWRVPVDVRIDPVRRGAF